MKAHRTTRSQDSRDAYLARVAAQFGALASALQSGAGIEQAAAQAGMDIAIAKMWQRQPRDMWPDAQ